MYTSVLACVRGRLINTKVFPSVSGLPGIQHLMAVRLIAFLNVRVPHLNTSEHFHPLIYIVHLMPFPFSEPNLYSTTHLWPRVPLFYQISLTFQFWTSPQYRFSYSILHNNNVKKVRIWIMDYLLFRIHLLPPISSSHSYSYFTCFIHSCPLLPHAPLFPSLPSSMNQSRVILYCSQDNGGMEGWGVLAI